MLFEQNQTILFIGDSITDCGRRDLAAPHGDGYVNIASSLLLARYPNLHLRFINRGVSGNTTRDLAARWQRDVLAEQPDWLSIMIGINDVWRAFGPNVHEAVPLFEYEATLRELLQRVQHETTARLILMEPYMIEADQSVSMRRQMDQYAAVVRELAIHYDAVLVRTQAAFDVVLEHTVPAGWAPDYIHPNHPGHAVIALAWLRAIGFDL